MSLNDNLWLKLLKQSTDRSTLADSLVVVVGDIEANKRALVSYLCGSQQSAITDEALLNLLQDINYDYFDIDENLLESSTSSSSSFASSTRVHMLALDQRMFPQLQEMIKINYNNNEQKILFLITLDLTQSSSASDEYLKKFKRWMKYLTSFSKQYFSHLSSEKRMSLQQLWYQYIINARLNRGGKLTTEQLSTEFDVGMVGNYRDGIEMFPFPLITVGLYSTSSMSFLASSSGGGGSGSNPTSTPQDMIQLNKFKEGIGKLRYYCLDLGASLMLLPLVEGNIMIAPPANDQSNNNSTSSSNNNNPPVNNPPQQNHLKRYISHRLYPDQITFDGLVMEEKLDRLFIPAGFDTIDLIQISTGVTMQPKDYQLAKLLSDVPNSEMTSGNPVPSSAAAVNNPATANIIELESEQEWLSGLHAFIAQATDSHGAKMPTSVQDEGEFETEKRKPSAVNSAVPSTANTATNTANNSKNVSPNRNEGTAGADKSAATAPAAAGAVPAAAAGRAGGSRRTSTRTTGATSATSTQDFFNSLLDKKK